MKAILRFLKDEQGATMVEYALMVALIAVFCIGAVTTLGEKIDENLKAAAKAIGGN